MSTKSPQACPGRFRLWKSVYRNRRCDPATPATRRRVSAFSARSIAHSFPRLGTAAAVPVSLRPPGLRNAAKAANRPPRLRRGRVSRARACAERKYSAHRPPPRPRHGYARLYRRMCNRERLSASGPARTDAEIDHWRHLSPVLPDFLFAGEPWCLTFPPVRGMFWL
jgi:hypothetical protein